MAIATERKIGFSILGPEKIARIHEASLHLVEKVGMRFGSERARKLLAEAGCAVDGQGIVKIPRRLVEAALAKAPKELALYNRLGERVMQIDRGGQVYFGCHSDMLEIVDPASGLARPFLKGDIPLMCHLANALPNLSFVLSVGLCADVAPAIQTEISFIETLKHLTKTINFSTNDVESLHRVIDLAALVAGGRKELVQKPFVFNYCEPIPPLTHPLESCEKLMISAEAGIPVVYMPYCMMGGTAPMSRAAALAQCNAEILAGLVLHQLAAEGAPFIYGAMPSILDMKTTVGSYGAVEFHLLVAAAGELSASYGLPFYGTAGCTDAKYLDEQAVAESTMEIFSTLLSKANLIHDIGVSDHCNSVNPLLVVLCDDLIEMLKHYTKGVAVTDEDLALELIAKVGPGGAFLTEPHTMKHFRQVHYSKLFGRLMKNPEASPVRAKIVARIAEIEKAATPPVWDPALLKELDARAADLAKRA